MLNVQLAKPSYSAKLKEEWELEKAVPVEDDREASGNPGTDELTLIASNNTVSIKPIPAFLELQKYWRDVMLCTACAGGDHSRQQAEDDFP